MADRKPIKGVFAPQRYSAAFENYLGSGGLACPEEDYEAFTQGGINRGDLSRFFAFQLAQDQIQKEGLTGDFAEVGVYKGHTANLLAKIVRRLDRHLYLFDTFEGFDQRDLAGVDSGQRLSFADTSLEAVRAFVGEQNVTFAQGYFPSTTSAIPPETQFALVHIDCDLYSPILSALEYFYPLMVPGGFCFVHDYSSTHWPGAERAVDQFLSTQAESLIPMPDSGGTAVFRKIRPASKTDNWLVRSDHRLWKIDAWVDAQSAAAGRALIAGWYNSEPWGLWGQGSSHTLKLTIDEGAPGARVLQADCQAALINGRHQVEVGVTAEGRQIAAWTFTQSNNRAIRSVELPVECIRDGEITLKFHPSAYQAPKTLNPDSKETRQLGLGLYRLRIH